jgi:hypothetical protein
MQAEPRQFTDDMREISGFGGGYEQQCRAMVLAGLDWLDAHPDADPKFHGYSGVYGIATEDNDDAKALTEAVVAATPDCTGAMHQAAVSHVLAARRMGWPAYVAKMRELKAEEAAR